MEGHRGEGSTAFGFDFQGDIPSFVKVDDGDLPLGEGQSTFTMATWFKADDFGPNTWHSILVKGSFGESWSVGLHLRTNPAPATVLYGFENCQNTAGLFEEGMWYHLAMTYDVSRTLKLYVDGSMISEKKCNSDPPTYSPSALGVGGKGARGNWPLLKGAIDDVVIINKALSAGDIARLTTNGICPIATSCVPVDNRVLLYLPGDGNADDLGPLGNDGKWCVSGKGRKCTGDMPPYAEGHSGPGSKAFGYDLKPGDLSFVKVDDSTLPLGEGVGSQRSSFTMAAWFKADDFGASRYQTIMVKGSFGEAWSVGLHLFAKGGSMVYGNRNCRNSAKPQSGSFKEGVWYHVALTFANTSMKFYVDGVLVGDLVCSLPPQTFSESALGIGGKGAKGNWPLVKGAIDEAVIFNTALSREEIKLLIIGGMCRTAPPCTPINNGVLMYLTGDGDPKDYSTRGNDGNWCMAGRRREDCSGNVPPYTEGHKGVGSKAFGFNLDSNVRNQLGFVKVDDSNLPLGEGRSSFTMATWFKVDNFAASRYQTIMVKGSFGEAWSVGLHLFSKGGSMVYGFRDCLGRAGSFAPGVWYHVALTFHYPVQKFYVDGVLLGEDECTTSPRIFSNSALGIGGKGAKGNWPIVSGAIDEALIFNSALSSSQILQLMGGGMCPIDTDCTPLDDRVLLYLPGDGNTNDLGPLKNKAQWCMLGQGRLCNGDPPPYVEGHIPGSTAFGFDVTPNVPDQIGFVKVDDSKLPLGEGQSSFTMATWFKSDNIFRAARWQTIMVKGSYGEDWSVGLHLSSEGAVRYGFINCRSDAGRFEEGVWYHLALTYESPMMKFYVDGALNHEMECNVEPPIYEESALGLGGKGAKGNWAFASGGMDEVVVLNYALSANDVKQLTKGGMCTRASFDLH